MSIFEAVGLIMVGTLLVSVICGSIELVMIMLQIYVFVIAILGIYIGIKTIVERLLKPKK